MLTHAESTALWASCPDEFVAIENGCREILRHAERLGSYKPGPQTCVEEPGEAASEQYEEHKCRGPHSMYAFERLAQLMYGIEKAHEIS